MSAYSSSIRQVLDFILINGEKNVFFFARFVQICSLILIIFQGFPPSQDDYNYVWALNENAPGLFIHLLGVRFNEFSGYPREMDMIKLVLEHARSLQSMIIRISRYLEENVNFQVQVMEIIMVQFRRLPRVSRCSNGFADKRIYMFQFD